MTPKKIPFNYDINRMEAVDLVSIIHIDDYDTRFLELILSNEGSPLNVDGCTVTARFVTQDGYLLNDSVPCTISQNTVTVPIDAAAVQLQACTLKIEISLTKDSKVLTLPFPLWIRVRGSILDDAQITPESEGTIPDLLKEAQQALDAATAAIEAASDYENMDNKPQINGVELIGNKASTQLGLQKELTAGENVTINEYGVISATGGTDDYNELSNKPQLRIQARDATQGELGFVNVDIEGVFSVIYGLELFYDSTGAKSLNFRNILTSSLRDDNKFLVGRYAYQAVYNFNSINYEFRKAGIWTLTAYYCSNAPSFITENFVEVKLPPYSSNYYSFDMVHIWSGDGDIARCIIGRDKQNLLRIYCQCIRVNFTNGSITKETEWQEIGGGSQIVSGVVNQNGTITFTDSDGNAFTTTGASVIGPQGPQGDDYVLTNQDKTDIANIVLQLLPNADVMSF